MIEENEQEVINSGEPTFEVIDIPIEDEILAPQPTTNIVELSKKQKAPRCAGITVHEGLEHKCKRKCKLDSEYCTIHADHPLLNEDMGKLDPSYAGRSLLNLHTCLYIVTQQMIKNTKGIQLDFVRELREKEEAYLQVYAEIYKRYGRDLDHVLTPAVTWLMLVSSDINEAWGKKKLVQNTEE